MSILKGDWYTLQQQPVWRVELAYGRVIALDMPKRDADAIGRRKFTFATLQPVQGPEPAPAPARDVTRTGISPEDREEYSPDQWYTRSRAYRKAHR